MSSPPSPPAIGLVSANIKLFNSKSDNENHSNSNTINNSNININNNNNNNTNNATTTSYGNNNTSQRPTVPPLPPKPIKITSVQSSPPASLPPTPPPLPPTPPPLPPLPARLSQKTPQRKQFPTPIVAQKSGSSTLKVMLGKVVGSVSGKVSLFFCGLNIELIYYKPK
jgi:p21-activated kinase 1